MTTPRKVLRRISSSTNSLVVNSSSSAGSILRLRMTGDGLRPPRRLRLGGTTEPLLVRGRQGVDSRGYYHAPRIGATGGFGRQARRAPAAFRPLGGARQGGGFPVPAAALADLDLDRQDVIDEGVAPVGIAFHRLRPA